MGFWQIIILSLFVSAKAQNTIGNCPPGLISDQVYDVIHRVESGGDLCKIDGNKIGPFQISKEYYDEATEFDPLLLNEGKSWGFVWGKGSREYSERVVRSRVCKYRNRNRQRMLPAAIGSRHRFGGMITDMGAFGSRIRGLIAEYDELPTLPTPEVCNPPCRLGECCKNGVCMCLNTDTLTVTECEGECEIGGLDLVFLLDASGSIGEDNFVAMKQLVKNIASSLTIGPENTRVAVIVFESGVRLEFNLNSYTNINSLSQAIDNIFYDSGGTSTHLALQLLRESAVSELLGVRPSTDTTHIAIVITDGQSNSPTATAEEARKVHTDTDFTVFAVGIGSGIGSDELTTIASRDDYVILATSFTTQEFQRLEADIRAETCTDSDQVDPNQPAIVSMLGERAVAYYRVQIPPEGVTFMFDLQDGRLLICGSTNTRNPDCRNPSSYEWRCEANSFCDYYAIGVARKRRQTGGNFMFISIEGVEKTNNFTMEVVEGDKRISAVAIPPTFFIDNVINRNDPLYEVPVIHTSQGMNATATSLCFQVHGESEKYYSLISDECIQANVQYEAMKNPQDGNFLKEIGILARNDHNNCTEIQLRSNRCIPKIDGIAFNESYDENGIKVEKTGKRSFEITVPNCKATQADDLQFRIRCQKSKGQKVIRFSVRRGSGIKPGAHGLIGQFWNIPVDVLNYAGNYSGTVNNTYVVTVDHPMFNSTSRTFIAELHPATWDGKRKECLYVGSAQSGAINEVDGPNDHVIEGTYDNYEVSGLFDSDFQYNQFQKDQCA